MSEAVEFKFASYNIHKAVGTDGRRDPDRILTVLRELDADIVALQEVDRRFGRRESVLPRAHVEEHGYQIVGCPLRPDSMGWHGNAILVRRGIGVAGSAPVHLPVLEPRGAVRAELRQGPESNPVQLRVVGMHLDLSGLRRREQLRTITRELAGCPSCPTVLMGDFNQWSARAGSMRELRDGWQALVPGKSFPSRQPLAALDRIVLSPEWQVTAMGVHHSALAAQASDHLPVWVVAAI